jgi:hypothetical protein
LLLSFPQNDPSFKENAILSFVTANAFFKQGWHSTKETSQSDQGSA